MKGEIYVYYQKVVKKEVSRRKGDGEKNKWCEVELIASFHPVPLLRLLGKEYLSKSVISIDSVAVYLGNFSFMFFFLFPRESQYKFFLHTYATLFSQYVIVHKKILHYF